MKERKNKRKKEQKKRKKERKKKKKRKKERYLSNFKTKTCFPSANRSERSGRSSLGLTQPSVLFAIKARSLLMSVPMYSIVYVEVEAVFICLPCRLANQPLR